MKTKMYAILAFVLLTSILTICLVGQAIPKTIQLEKDDKTDTAYQDAISKSGKWIRNTLERLNSGGDMGEAEVVALLSLYSEKTTEQRDTLKGLHGVGVIVEKLKTEAEKYGLTEELLQTAVELRLRQHGIRINSSGSCLYININAVVSEEAGYAVVGVNIAFVQAAVLLRNPKTRFAAVTWKRSSDRLFELGKLRTVREDVLDYVDVFINDYLAANPKELPAEEPKKPIDFRPAEENNNKLKDD